MVEPSGLESFELVQGGGFIGEQEQPGFRVLGHVDAAVVNPVVDPILGDTDRLRDLGNGQMTVDATWMRLTALTKKAVVEADRPHVTG